MIIGKADVSVLVLMVSYHEYLITYINDFIDSTSTIREVNTAVNRVNDILEYNSHNVNEISRWCNSYRSWKISWKR